MYYFRDLHRCEVRVDELFPGKKVDFRRKPFQLHEGCRRTEAPASCSTSLGRATRPRSPSPISGLVPEFECYSTCSDGWRTYVNVSLKNLIPTGEGSPNKGEATTESEQSLSR